MLSPLLEFDSLTKRFGDVTAVSALTEAIAAGEYFCILGPSGCGKTTLLRMIAGFEEPTIGTITLDGKRIDQTPPEKRDVNIVFQSYALFPHMTVYDNVAFGLRARGHNHDVVHMRVAGALDLVRLEQERARFPRQLSGGQQQRVALARALVMQPRVLLLDEPLSALDRHLRLAMQEELRRIHAETGLTFIHITHDQSEALALGSRVAVMRAGRFVQVATPGVLYRQPAHRFVAEFVGTSNLLDATIDSLTPPRVAAGAIILTAAALPDNVALKDRVVVSVRPEAVRIGTGGDRPNSFRARVRSVAFAGPAVELVLDASGQRWLAHLPARGETGDINVGADVNVSIDPHDVVIIRDHE